MNQKNKILIIKVIDIEERIRIDKYLEIRLKELGYDTSRNQIQNNISNIKLNDKHIKKNTLVKKDDIITFSLPTPQIITLEPENIPINIVYQDKDLAIINKPPGMVVHPAKGNYSHTLVNALLYHIKDLQDIGGTIRPGIVHRLDKDTSGLMVVAKNEKCHNHLIKLFKMRKVKKIYHCIIQGIPKYNSMVIDNCIGRHPMHRKKFAVIENGKPAKTKMKIIKKMNKASLVKINLYTGRTHQIRVHMAYLGHPILGDPIYSRTSNKYNEGMALVSKELTFVHPSSGEEMEFKIDYPEHFKIIIDNIDNI